MSQKYNIIINNDNFDYVAEHFNNVTILKYTEENIYGETNKIAIEVIEGDSCNYKIIIDDQIIYLDIFQAEKIAAALIIATAVKININQSL